MFRKRERKSICSTRCAKKAARSEHYGSVFEG